MWDPERTVCSFGMNTSHGRFHFQGSLHEGIVICTVQCHIFGIQQQVMSAYKAARIKQKKRPALFAVQHPMNYDFGNQLVTTNSDWVFRRQIQG